MDVPVSYTPLRAEQVPIHPEAGFDAGAAFAHLSAQNQVFPNATQVPGDLFPIQPELYLGNPALQLAGAFQFFQAPPMLHLSQNLEGISDEELNILELEAREISANLARFAADFGMFALQVNRLRGNRNGV